MKTQRGMLANPIPSQFNPLLERLARLYLKSHGFDFSGDSEDLFRSRNPRTKRAIAFAMVSICELEEWMLDASGNGLEEFGEFITGEEDDRV
jgi:hypothetical protein